MPTPLLETLRNAWESRSALRARTQAFRLLNGVASGTPGLAIDLFAGHPVVYAYDTGLSSRYPGLAEALRQVTGAPGAALIDRSAPDESGREAGSFLYGEVPETVITEEGPSPEAAPSAAAPPVAAAAGTGAFAAAPLRFEIHLRHPRNVGLFLDTRPLRDRLRATSAGADVLNLFAYSCSLGLAAAAGGAASVVNVDVSARYLGWGKENFRLSGFDLAPEKARFTRMDGEEYLDWAARKGRRFGIVVLDPPSFSRADGKTFGFEKDYFRLLSKAASLLAPGGRAYAVTNFGGITAARFRAGAQEAFAQAGRKAISLRAIPQAEDFDPTPDGSARTPGSISQGGAGREGAFLALEAEAD
jgi:23S rRNA (cytosine1962-C5)-methyltransferase